MIQFDVFMGRLGYGISESLPKACLDHIVGLKLKSNWKLHKNQNYMKKNI